ncbi:MAG TPA: fused MFS/spermidine synthase [Acidimicrobiia bacterium]|nr:fused MFS/spermidine synthase [Acidimicrobiia bacterium]
MSPVLARSLVFFTSASVLVIEILAARLLAPYLGVSLEVFTGIIGVILAGISLGAWLGGRSADRTVPNRLPGPLLMAGGLTALASPLIIDAIGPTLRIDAVSIVFAAAAGFFAPAAILSAVPPVIVKIQLDSLDETGRVVGTYSAIGTAGAILGTFVTGFVLIAAFPTRPIVVVLGAALTVTGVAMSLTRSSWTVMSVAAAGVLGFALIASGGPCEYETTYHCAIVEEDPANPSGRTLILDRLHNSYVDLEDPTYLEFRYIKLIADIMETESADGPLEVVSIGGGGFTMPGYIEHTRPRSTNTVLEIDSKLVEIGSNDLALTDAINVILEDARISLRGVGADSADVVIGDAYSGASVPWHLTTVEYMSEIERVLAPAGTYVMNVIDYGNLEFVRSQALTLRQVFPEVALFAPDSYLAGETGGNFILVAANDEIGVGRIEERIASRGGSERGIQDTELTRFIGEAQVLTDDFAPVDQMLGRP